MSTHDERTSDVLEDSMTYATTELDLDGTNKANQAKIMDSVRQLVVHPYCLMEDGGACDCPPDTCTCRYLLHYLFLLIWQTHYAYIIQSDFFLSCTVYVCVFFFNFRETLGLSVCVQFLYRAQCCCK